MDSGDDDGDYTSCGADSKDWEKFERQLTTEGYREGIQQGEEEELQKYFDLAQEFIFHKAFRLGQLQGILAYGMLALKESELSPIAQAISNDVIAEVKRIKLLRLPEDTHYDEFMKTAEEEMDQRFQDFKDRIANLDPEYQKNIEALNVGLPLPAFPPTLLPTRSTDTEGRLSF